MTTSAVGVYLNADTVQYHLCQFKNSQPFVDCEIYREVDLFLNSQHQQRVAVLHVPFPLHTEFDNQVDQLLKSCDHIFITCTELHLNTVDFIHQHDDPKITYYVCGYLNFDLVSSKIYQFMDWFETSRYFYRNWLPELLFKLNPFTSKRQTFDALLGNKKPHRDFVFDNISNRPADFVCTYFKNNGFNLNQWEWEQHGVKLTHTPSWTVEPVEYYGHPISISQILPLKIYNQTAYSIVAETCYWNHFSFYTEKTAKPIIARRLFVVFAGQGHLRNLRQLGFRTFDSIINESYDDEPDDMFRWQRAWDQVEWLKRQPQEAILEEIRPIAEHNFEVMMSRDWYGQFRDQFEQDFARITHG